MFRISVDILSTHIDSSCRHFQELQFAAMVGFLLRSATLYQDSLCWSGDQKNLAKIFLMQQWSEDLVIKATSIEKAKYEELT